MNVFADSNDPVETQTSMATGRGLPGGGRAEAQHRPCGLDGPYPRAGGSSHVSWSEN